MSKFLGTGGFHEENGVKTAKAQKMTEDNRAEVKDADVLAELALVQAELEAIKTGTLKTELTGSKVDVLHQPSTGVAIDPGMTVTAVDYTIISEETLSKYSYVFVAIRNRAGGIDADAIVSFQTDTSNLISEFDVTENFTSNMHVTEWIGNRGQRVSIKIRNNDESATRNFNCTIMGVK